MASIKLDKVSVEFPIYDASSRSLKKHFFGGSTGGNIGESGSSGHYSVVQALNKVTVGLGHGTRIGLVGHNGAGKSTLLRVLAGIYEPTSGTVSVEGNVAPLFDISLGMDIDATGYENIILRGLFLGLKKKEIEAKVDDIAKFTELGDFLSLPIRTYSTGMRMRLSFAVSTAIEPDILLLDEGIGAGDAAFLDKANRRLQEFTRRAAIIVLASHSEALLRRMCRRVILMERGTIARIGPTAEVLKHYKQTR